MDDVQVWLILLLSQQAAEGHTGGCEACAQGGQLQVKHARALACAHKTLLGGEVAPFLMPTTDTSYLQPRAKSSSSSIRLHCASCAYNEVGCA